jgi:phosphoglycerate dehydrogenase-like enzyme
MKLLIAVQHRFPLWVPPPWFAQKIGETFPSVRAVQVPNYEQAEAHLGDAEVMITWSLRPEQVARAHKLRWVHSTAAAVHALLTPELIASDIVITNASIVHGTTVAEHAMAMLLALARRLPSAVRFQQRHQWAQEGLWAEYPPPRRLQGSVLGLVGVGAIGGEIARLGLACGMKVLAVRRSPWRGADFLESVPAGGALQVYGIGRLDDVLAQSEFLVLATPLTPVTRGLIGSEQLRKMKRDGYLVNVGRGALVDEAALVDAIRQGQLGGAALDVFEHEPLPPESPLWDLPAVLITPHAGGMAAGLWERHYDLFAENMRRYLAGEPLLHVVDKSAGY